MLVELMPADKSRASMPQGYFIDIEGAFVLCKLRPLLRSIHTKLNASLRMLICIQMKNTLKNNQFDLMLKKEASCSYFKFYRTDTQIEKDLRTLVIVLALAEKYIKSQQFSRGALESGIRREVAPKAVPKIDKSDVRSLKMDVQISGLGELSEDDDLNWFLLLKKKALRLMLYYSICSLGSKNSSQSFNLLLKEGLLSNLQPSIKYMFKERYMNLNLMGLYNYAGFGDIFNEMARAQKKIPTQSNYT